jgi:hypothetical protein
VDATRERTLLNFLTGRSGRAFAMSGARCDNAVRQPIEAYSQRTQPGGTRSPAARAAARCRRRPRRPDDLKASPFIRSTRASFCRAFYEGITHELRPYETHGGRTGPSIYKFHLRESSVNAIPSCRRRGRALNLAGAATVGRRTSFCERVEVTDRSGCTDWEFQLMHILPGLEATSYGQAVDSGLETLVE